MSEGMMRLELDEQREIMRRIDGKFHIDGDQIIKTSNGDPIPEEEPLILIRARDYLALPLLKYYAVLSKQDGCNDFHMEGIERVIEKFERFQMRYPERMKQPGITRGL